MNAWSDVGQKCVVKRLDVQDCIRTLRRGAFLHGNELMLLVEVVVALGLFRVAGHRCTDAMRLSETRSKAVDRLHV